MVSGMEATEGHIFKAEEILMARHTTLVLQKKRISTHNGVGYETNPWFGLVHHLDALIPNLKDASCSLARISTTTHLVHSLKNILI